MSVEGYLGLLSFCLTSLCDWSETRTTFLTSNIINTSANHDFVNYVFPRFGQYAELSLALGDIDLWS